MKSATVILVLVTFAAIAAYLAAGTPEPVNAGVGQHPLEATAAVVLPVTNPAKSLPAVADMLQRLELRLEREPEDAKGWNLLGRSYEHLGRRDEAEAAFARAVALGYERPLDPEHASVSLRGVVTLDPSFAEKVAGTDTVFIFARAVSGPRMPVAVLRKSASQLPIEFELNDSMAMTPEFRLSGFDEVIVGARISANGEATVSTGDLEGYSGVVSVSSADPVTITVDQSVLTKPAATQSGG